MWNLLPKQPDLLTAKAKPIALNFGGGGTTGMANFYDAQKAAGVDPLNAANLHEIDSDLGTPGMPDAKGAWLKPANFGLDVAKIGLGAISAMDQIKMNKFMRGYYGDQMAMQKTDFTNAARSSNEALEGKRSRQLSAMGMGVGGEANTKGVADYMAKWGAKETV